MGSIGRVLLSAVLVMLCSGAARASIVYFNCFPIDGSQEVPPNPALGTGIGFCTLDTVTNDFTWNISYTGLGSPATAAHFHNAPAGVAGPIVIPVPPPSPIIGSTVVTPSQAAAILANNWYFNVHTTVNPGGELRGQVVNAGCIETYNCFPIDGAQEVPPKAVPGTGVGTCTLDLASSMLSWHIAYSGLTTAATAAHFHVAPAGVSGPIVISLGTANPNIGSAAVTLAQTAEIQAGNWYFNVHTLMNPTGELRGQVVDTGCLQWAELGNGKPGGGGLVPELVGIGPMDGGSLNQVDLFAAMSGSLTTLFVGFTAINAPFKDGILVPAPNVLVPGLLTSGSGRFTLPFVWPTDLILVGFDLYWQQWVPDPLATKGVSASTALRNTGQ